MLILTICELVGGAVLGSLDFIAMNRGWWSDRNGLIAVALAVGGISIGGAVGLKAQSRAWKRSGWRP